MLDANSVLFKVMLFSLTVEITVILVCTVSFIRIHLQEIGYGYTVTVRLSVCVCELLQSFDKEKLETKKNNSNYNKSRK